MSTVPRSGQKNTGFPGGDPAQEKAVGTSQNRFSYASMAVATLVVAFPLVSIDNAGILQLSPLPPLTAYGLEELSRFCGMAGPQQGLRLILVLCFKWPI